MAESPTMQMLKKGKEGNEVDPEVVAEAVAQVDETEEETEEAPKSKIKVVKKTAKGKVPTDLIEKTVHEIENLTKAKALKEARAIVDQQGQDSFRMGGVLAIIQGNGWFDEYDTFQSFIENEFGLKYRKALYLVSMYNCLVESGVKWNQVKDIGWTKLSTLATVLTEDNAEDWVVKAKEMTLIQLRSAIKEAQNSGTGNAPKNSAASEVTSMTFKLHADQKETIRAVLDKAKGDFKTEHDAVALENMCMAYGSGKLGKAKAAKSVSMNEQMETLGVEGTLNILGSVFPDLKLTVEMA